MIFNTRLWEALPHSGPDPLIRLEHAVSDILANGIDVCGRFGASGVTGGIWSRPLLFTCTAVTQCQRKLSGETACNTDHGLYVETEK